MENWYIGQKVVCVSNFLPEVCSRYNADVPIKNNIYTVSEVVFGGMGLLFKELNCGVGFGYDSIGFKPIDDLQIEEVDELVEVLTKQEELVV